MSRHLYYGDNLDVMRRKIHDECVDLCYIDPPFNSKRNYNQIYNNVGSEDQAQAQAFIREKAELAVFLTLERPTDGMEQEANAVGYYEHPLMSRNYPRIQLVTINDLVEHHKRLDIPMSLEVLKKAQVMASVGQQGELLDDDLPMIPKRRSA